MTSSSSSSSSAVESQNLNILLVHEVQQGNPLLAFIKNVKWKVSNEIKPDYVMGSTCAIFVSVKYHFRHPKVRFDIWLCVVFLFTLYMMYVPYVFD